MVLLGCEQDVNTKKAKVFLCAYDETVPVIRRATTLKNGKDEVKLLKLKDSLFQENESLEVERAYLTYRTGQLYNNRSKFEKAIGFYDDALRQFLAADTVIMGRVIQMNFNLANCYSSVGMTDSAGYYAEQGLEIIYSNDACPVSENKAVYLYRQAGNSRIKSGDLPKSIYYFEKGVEICQSSSPRYAYCGALFEGYAYALLESGKAKEAKAAVEEAESYFTNAGALVKNDSSYLADVYETYFAIADKEENPGAAIAEARKSLAINLAIRSESIFAGHSYNNLGRILIKQGENKQGEALLRKALDLYVKNEHYLDQGTCFENFAESYFLQGDTITGLAYLDSAELAYHGYPEAPGLNFALDKQQLKDPIFRKAKVISALHLSRPEEFPLQEVNRQVNRVDSIISLLRYSLSSEASKREAIGELRKLYDRLINFSHQQWLNTGDVAYQQVAINLLERGKAQILQERQRRTFQNTKDVINGQSAKIRDLREGYDQLKKELRKSEELSDRQAIGIKINRQELQLRKLEEENYRKRNTQHEIKPGNNGLVAISQTLKKGEVVLDYFLGNEACFVAVADKNGVSLKRLAPNTADLSAMVNRLKNCLDAPVDRKWRNDRAWREEKEKARLEISYRLYGDLVADVLPEAQPIDRITIIPDGVLAYLPFGGLLTKQVIQKDGMEMDMSAYLLNKYNINYEFSAGIWLDRTKLPPTKGAKTLVVAPSQEKARQFELAATGKKVRLAALSRIDEEVAAVSGRMDSEELQGRGVRGIIDKETFDEYGVLHFAGHGVVFPDDIYQSFLALEVPKEGAPTLLRLQDLEAKKLDIQLLVLSACKTGTGVLAQEEGVISLSRAGAIAGARSVISSLWLVSQETKPEMFRVFYERLATGARRDEALRAAQLHIFNYSNRYQHPYYWAGFINTGSGAALDASFFR